MKRTFSLRRRLKTCKASKVSSKEDAGVRVARYVLKGIQEGMRFLASSPEAGHKREDLTDHPVRFWPVFSYLIVYLPEKKPLEVVRVLHGRRDVQALLK